MRFIIGLTAVLMSLVTVGIHAEPVAALYQVREELVSQASDVRDAGLQQAFITMVQRLTGRADAAQSAQLAEYLADPQPLISHYGYDGNTLLVNFDSYTVQSALRAAELPMWGSNRPAVLTWWQVAGLHDVQLLSDGQANTQVLHNAAQYYAVPARFPLGDLTEQLLISADAFTAHQDIRASAERYNADVVVIVQQDSATELQTAQWQLWVGDERQEGQVRAQTQEALAREVFSQVNQHLAQRYAVKPGAGEVFDVRVAGVDLERFVLLERLLEPFSAQLREVTQDYAQWQLRSNPQQVRSQLGLANLQEKPLPAAAVTQVALEDGLSTVFPTETGIGPVTQQPSTADVNTQILYFTW
ncbi:MAG TPA: DUF2066 domain-containing protein [Thiopseudomonas sp.]|nr:DUF2066 domain-containing protein [Thiopseudomonas sp.]